MTIALTMYVQTPYLTEKLFSRTENPKHTFICIHTYHCSRGEENNLHRQSVYHITYLLSSGPSFSIQIPHKLHSARLVPAVVTKQNERKKCNFREFISYNKHMQNLYGYGCFSILIWFCTPNVIKTTQYFACKPGNKSMTIIFKWKDHICSTFILYRTATQ